MLLDPGRDREHIGIEDDIFWREADSDQQPVGTLADFHLARLRIGLPQLVERHHHHRRAVAHADSRVMQERLLAFLHADRIDDRLAGDAFQPRFDHVPFRTVDHHRHARDIRLCGDQLQEGRHRMVRVEQPLVHVDVDHLRAILDLLSRDLDGARIVARHDHLLERRRSGDVGPLTDVDERGGGIGGHSNSIIPAHTGIRSSGRQRMWLWTPACTGVIVKVRAARPPS